MKSLTGISQGFDKCTKAALQKNYFWGTTPDDCFCLGIWSRYDYDKKRQKSTILIWRSSRKMNRNKNLLILYYLWKKFSKFSNEQKKVFLFNFVPQQILNFLLMFHFMKLIASKLKQCRGSIGKFTPHFPWFLFW